MKSGQSSASSWLAPISSACFTTTRRRSNAPAPRSPTGSATSRDASTVDAAPGSLGEKWRRRESHPRKGIAPAQGSLGPSNVRALDTPIGRADTAGRERKEVSDEPPTAGFAEDSFGPSTVARGVPQNSLVEG